jgi:hypothetical protein
MKKNIFLLLLSFVLGCGIYRKSSSIFDDVRLFSYLTSEPKNSGQLSTVFTKITSEDTKFQDISESAKAELLEFLNTSCTKNHVPTKLGTELLFGQIKTNGTWAGCVFTRTGITTLEGIDIVQCDKGVVSDDYAKTFDALLNEIKLNYRE